MTLTYPRWLQFCSRLLPALAVTLATGCTSTQQEVPGVSEALILGPSGVQGTALDDQISQAHADTEAFLAAQNHGGATTADPTFVLGPDVTSSQDPAAVERTLSQPPPTSPEDVQTAAEASVTIDATSSSPEFPDPQSQRRQLLLEYARQLWTDSQYSDSPLRQMIALAAVTIVDPDRAIDPAAMPDLTQEEQQVLAVMQAHFTRIGDVLAQGDADPTQALIKDLRETARALSQTSPLNITTAELCTRVDGYGIYEPFGDAVFLAHTPQEVILYLEIDGFTSETNAIGEWVTITEQQWTIYSDADGIPVWSEPSQTAVDVSQKKRRDYFTVQPFFLPEKLSVGKYQLKLRLRDEKSGAETETTIPFMMTAQAASAAGN